MADPANSMAEYDNRFPVYLIRGSLAHQIPQKFIVFFGLIQNYSALFQPEFSKINWRTLWRIPPETM